MLTTSFEAWKPGGRTFDLVLAATSFHWVDPGVRFTKAAAVLRPHGALAVFANQHVRTDEGFFAEQAPEIEYLHNPTDDDVQVDVVFLGIPPRPSFQARRPDERSIMTRRLDDLLVLLLNEGHDPQIGRIPGRVDREGAAVGVEHRTAAE